MTDEPRLSDPPPLKWLCPVCGAVVADDLLVAGSPRPPLHDHDGPVEFVPRAEG